MLMKNKTNSKLAALRCWLSRLVGLLLRLSLVVILVGIHHKWFNIGSRGSWMSLADGAMIAVWTLLLVRVAFGRLSFTPSNTAVE